MTFAEVPLGTLFWCNGNHCLKRSTRTAYLLAFERVFYFRQHEMVTV